MTAPAGNNFCYASSVGACEVDGLELAVEESMGAFADRVTRRFEIGAAEQRFLERLESAPHAVARSQLIARSGEPSDQAFVLMSGWAMSYTQFADGSHQVRRLHFPGDLLAMPSIAMRTHAEDVEALSDAVVAPFPKTMLARMFAMPRLAAIMYMFAQAERVTAGDRLASLGHSCARGRVAFLVMDILNRLRSADSSVTSSFYMHLTREQIAHVVGITPVHASRTWSSLLRDELISCRGRTVTIEDEGRLLELSGYLSRDGEFDIDWLRHVEKAGGAQLAGLPR